MNGSAVNNSDTVEGGLALNQLLEDKDLSPGEVRSRYLTAVAAAEAEHNGLLVKRNEIEEEINIVLRKKTALLRLCAAADRMCWLQADREERPLEYDECEFLKISFVGEGIKYVSGRRIERLTVVEGDDSLRFTIENRTPYSSTISADIVIVATDRAYNNWASRHAARIERVKNAQEGGLHEQV